MILHLKAKHYRKHPAASLGDKVHIYTKKKPFDKYHVSACSDYAYKVDEISHAHGLPFYRTRNRARPFLWHDFVKKN